MFPKRSSSRTPAFSEEAHSLSTCGWKIIYYGKQLFHIWGHNEEDLLPPKVRELIEELQQAGFVDRGGKGNHRNFVHSKISRPITISGKPGEDAKQYQIRAVRSAIKESKE